MFSFFLRYIFAAKFQNRPFQHKLDSRMLTGLEPLEERCMLDGTVEAFVYGRDMWLLGDDSGNSLEVLVDDQGVQVTAVGQTMINGSPEFRYESAKGIRNLFVRLSGGDDQLDFRGQLSGMMQVWAGKGNDQIGIADSSLRTLLIVGQDGNDDVTLNQSEIGFTTILLDRGDDRFVVRDSGFRRFLTVIAGAGQDDIAIVDSNVGSNGIIDSGVGDDDILISDVDVRHSFTVVSGAGADNLLLEDYSSSGQLILDLGSGADSLMTSNVKTGFGLAIGGSGNDRFSSDDASEVHHLSLQDVGSFGGAWDARIRQDLLAQVGGSVEGNENFSPSVGDLTYAVAGPLTAPAEDGLLSLAVDADGDPLSVSVVSQPNHGNLQVSPDGSFLYVPDSDYQGTDSFQFAVSDGSSAVTAKVSLNIDFSVVELTVASAVEGVSAGFVDDSLIGAVFDFAQSEVPAELLLMADDHFFGNPSASLVLIEYVDFQCPTCKAYHEILKQLLDNRPDDVLLIQRHLPLSIHSNAVAAAIAVEVADRQGYFQQYVDLLFQKQDDWKNASDPNVLFTDYASQLGMDLAKFESDLLDSAIRDRVQRDQDSAVSLGLSATPSLFINGQLVSLPQTLAELEAIVDAEVTALARPYSLNRKTGEFQVARPEEIDGIGETVRHGVYSVGLAGTATNYHVDVTLVQQPLEVRVSNAVDAGSDWWITRSADIELVGTANPMSELYLDLDGDGQFDDGQATVQADGGFTLNALAAAEVGDNHFVIQEQWRGAVIATYDIDVRVAVGTVVEFQTTEGRFFVELLDDAAPLTVANFLSYGSAYPDTIIHRSPHPGGDDFVIQGGGFRLTDTGDLEPVTTFDPVVNEFSPVNSNQRGTLAIALPGNNINGGTSQWFINAADNSFLDSGKYTVFGMVLGEGKDVVDRLHQIPTYDLTRNMQNNNFADLPLVDYELFSRQLSGLVSVETGKSTVTGFGTKFLEELVVGEEIEVSGAVFVVTSIASDTELTVGQPPFEDFLGVANSQANPTFSQYVRILSIEELDLPV